MQTLATLKVVPVWVDRDHLVHSARLLMDGHGLPAIAVLDRAGTPVGVLRRERIADLAPETRVAEAMEPVAETIETDRSLREAADAMIRTQRTFLPLVEGPEFRGLVTAMDLLDGLRRSFDPMTTLSWSDELRRWGGEQLERGQEIAVLFIDLDQFGGFNRNYGHVIGDRVLRRVADFLAERTDPARDILVRYGGDEFAIGTTRDRNEAEALAALLAADLERNPLVESGETIRFVVGVDGGKRQVQRDVAHVQATLDDLINLASRRCIANKGAQPATAAATEQAVIQPHPPPREPIFSVVEVRADDDPNSIAHVTIRRGEEISVGVGMRQGRSLEEAVAFATARAADRLLEEETIEVVRAERTDAGSVVQVRILRGGNSTENTSPPITGERNRAIAEATLLAINPALPAPATGE